MRGRSFMGGGFKTAALRSSAPAPVDPWPNASNTGPRSTPGIPITGDFTTTSDGQVVTGLDVTNGTITVAHKNVTVRDCSVNTTGVNGILVQVGATGATIEYNEITGAQTGIAGFGLIQRNNISGVENGISITNGDGAQVLYNYIHDFFALDPHYDGIAAQGGFSNFLIQWNNIDGGSNSIQGIFLTTEFGAADNITIDVNRIRGTSYCIVVGTGITGAVVTNNLLEKGANWYYNFAVSVSASGNVSTRGYYIDGDAAPTVGEVAFTPSTTMSGNDANINTGFRVAATLAAAGSEFRVIFKSGTAGTDLRGMAIGKQSSGVNSALALQELTFGGETLVANPIEMTNRTELASDWFTPPSSLTVGDVMLVGFAMENPGGTALATGASNSNTYFGAVAGYDDAAPTSWNTSSGTAFGILRIETRSAA